LKVVNFQLFSLQIEILSLDHYGISNFAVFVGRQAAAKST